MTNEELNNILMKMVKRTIEEETPYFARALLENAKGETKDEVYAAMFMNAINISVTTSIRHTLELLEQIGIINSDDFVIPEGKNPELNIRRIK